MRRPSIGVRAVVLGALVAACAASAVFAGGVIGYTPAFALAVALLACAGFVRFAAGRIEPKMSAPAGECLRGESLLFEVRTASSSLAPFLRADVHVVLTAPYRCSDVSQVRTCLLAGRADDPFAFRCVFEHVGVYRAGVAAVRVYDPFGLLWRTVEAGEYAQVVVGPRVSDLDELAVDPDAVVESQHMLVPVADEGMDYAGVRGYVQGDPLKSIHWKLSARKGEHLTRLYETFSNPGVTVLVDLNASGLEEDELALANDLLVEVLFSLAAIARAGGLEFEALYRGRDGQAHRLGTGDFEDVSGVLAELPLLSCDDERGASGFCDFARDEARDPARHSTFALLSAGVTPALVEAALSVREASRVPLVLVCLPALADIEVEKGQMREAAAFEQAGVFFRRFSALSQVEGVWRS